MVRGEILTKTREMMVETTTDKVTTSHHSSKAVARLTVIHAVASISKKRRAKPASAALSDAL